MLGFEVPLGHRLGRKIDVDEKMVVPVPFELSSWYSGKKFT